MSILSDFEDRVSGAIEGMFAGVFRAPVQPAELARACAKEMYRRKKLGVGRVYAPTMYSVLLSPKDGDQLGGFADTLAGELATYIVSYAAERDYVLKARPVVRFLIDDGLKLGRYEVIGELLSESEIAAITAEDDSYYDPETDSAQEQNPPTGSPGLESLVADMPAASVEPQTTVPPMEFVEPIVEPPVAVAPIVAPVVAEHVVQSPDEVPVTQVIQSTPARLRPRLRIPGTSEEIELRGDRVVVGRLAACDICLSDVNVSREHAAFVPEGAGWVIEDLGSTNGTKVNGSPAGHMRLRDRDVITIGINEIHYLETES